MKANQSLHLVVKQPPNSQPVKSLGIFDDLDNPNLPRVIQNYLNGTLFEPKSEDFKANVRTEVLRSIENGTIISVARQGDTLQVTIQLAKESPQ
jgi:hypothetical protein